MKGTWIAIGAVGLVAVAVAALLVGRGRGSSPEVRLPTPETGGPVPTAPGKQPAGKTAVTPISKGEPPSMGESTGKARPAPGGKVARRPAPPEPTRIKREVYRNPKLNLAIEKPRSTDWLMADKKANFRGVPHPAKVLEFRRQPQGGQGGFAHMDLYVVDLSLGASEAEAAEKIEKLEGFTKWSESGKFTVLDERTVEIGGRTMTRRLLRLDFQGRTIRFVTVRAVRKDKLYVLVGFTDPSQFDDVLPEFEQAIRSLRID